MHSPVGQVKKAVVTHGSSHVKPRLPVFLPPCYLSHKCEDRSSVFRVLGCDLINMTMWFDISYLNARILLVTFAIIAHTM